MQIRKNTLDKFILIIDYCICNTIYCPAVDDELNLTVAQQSELDWLLYNAPMEYVQLLLSGEVYQYLKATPEHGLED